MSKTSCKTPKGTIDLDGDQYLLIDYLKKEAEVLFQEFGGQFLETPVFERTDVLTSKLGEENLKEIYSIQNREDIDQEEKMEEKKKDKTKKEELSLRFDLTVPLVRYLILNKIEKLKSARIGKVYRRDDSSHLQLRYREFYQADFDWVGYPVGLPEVEVFSLIELFMKRIGIDDYQIFYNYRENLSSIYQLADIPKNMTMSISSSIDKLDKKPWEEIAQELTDKGLNKDQLFKLKELLDQNYLDPNLEIVQKMITSPKSVFQASLARGLDYYTGLIYEIKIGGIESRSVGGGGRYDRLVKDMGGSLIPILGLSFGLSRLVTFLTEEKKEMILKKKKKEKLKIWIHNLPFCSTEEYQEFRLKKIQLANQLREWGYIVEYNYSKKKLTMEINYCLPLQFDLMVLLGGNEYQDGYYVIKKILNENKDKDQEQEQTQENVKFEDLKEYLNQNIN